MRAQPFCHTLRPFIGRPGQLQGNGRHGAQLIQEESNQACVQRDAAVQHSKRDCMAD